MTDMEIIRALAALEARVARLESREAAFVSPEAVEQAVRNRWWRSVERASGEDLDDGHTCGKCGATASVHCRLVGCPFTWGSP